MHSWYLKHISFVALYIKLQKKEFNACIYRISFVLENDYDIQRTNWMMIDDKMITRCHISIYSLLVSFKHFFFLTIIYITYKLI